MASGPDLTESLKSSKRKSRQSKFSAASAAAGLAGTTALGTAAVIRRPHLLKASYWKTKKLPESITLKKPDLSTPELREKYANKLKDKGYIAGSIAGGIGGLGGLHFAAMQRAESKKEKDEVKKSIESERQRRQRATSAGLAVGAGGLLGATTLPDKRIRADHKTRNPLKMKRAKKAMRKELLRSRATIAGTGAALGGLAIANEIHRNRGGRQYQGYFDYA